MSLFNSPPRFAQCHLPSAWKSANITALHKKGAKTDPYNCRSIFPSIISKVMESIITSDINSFIFSNGLISDHQFGFKPGHSTLDMLLLLSQQWMDVLNVKHYIRAISLDISRAFDRDCTLPCSPNSLPMVSKAISTHGSQTSSPVAVTVWP